MKKRLFLCAIIVFMLNLTAVADEINYTNGGAVIYRNDFSDYTGGAFSDVIWNGTACWNEIGAFSKGENNGNIGLKAASSTKAFYCLPETLTSGCLYVSFDISRGENTSGQSYFAMQDDSGIVQSGVHDKYVFYADAGIGAFFGPAANIGNWGDKSVTLAYEKNTVYSVQLVCDYSGKKQYTYIDGELLSMVPFEGINSDYTGISQLKFLFAGVDYVDNIHISYMNEDSFRCEAKVVDDRTVTVEFTEGLSSDGLILNADVINTLTNEKATISEITKQDFFRYTIKLEDKLDEGDEYCIKPQMAITNILGKALSEDIIFSRVSDHTKLYLRGAESVDYNGNAVKLYEELASPSNKIRLVFTDVLKQAPTGLTSNAGKIKNISLSEDKKTVTVEFDEYFFGDGKYELNVPSGIEGEGGKSSAKEYSLTFETGDGSVVYKTFGFYKNGNPVKAEDLNDGDKITLNAEIIKTNKMKYPVILSYSAWENMIMTGFDFRNLSLAETETYKSGSIEIVYDKESGTKIQGFLRKGISFINPLAEHIEL